MNSQKKIGLALSGGGARGIAHIGVIKALQEHNIKVHSISGASAGSIVGALLAAGISIPEMIRFVRESSLLKVYEIGLPLAGLTKLNYLKKQLAKFIAIDSFEALQVPLYIAAANLNSGKCQFFSDGQLFDVVMASSSIPLIFKPVKINGEWFVDGGVLNNLPIEPLLEKEKVDVLIGVNLMPLTTIKNKSFSTGINIGLRCSEMLVANNSIAKLENCDVPISLPGIEKYPIYSFSKVDDLVEIGYEGAMKALESFNEPVRQPNGSNIKK